MGARDSIGDSTAGDPRPGSTPGEPRPSSGSQAATPNAIANETARTAISRFILFVPPDSGCLQEGRDARPTNPPPCRGDCLAAGYQSAGGAWSVRARPT